MILNYFSTSSSLIKFLIQQKTLCEWKWLSHYTFLKRLRRFFLPVKIVLALENGMMQENPE